MVRGSMVSIKRTEAEKLTNAFDERMETEVKITGHGYISLFTFGKETDIAIVVDSTFTVNINNVNDIFVNDDVLVVVSDGMPLFIKIRG